MKDINFINAPSAHNQYDTNRWLLISCMLFATAMMIIASKQILQLCNLVHAQSACSSAEQQVCTHAQCLETYRTYTEQTRTIAKKRDHLNALRASLTRAAQCIQDITSNKSKSTLEHCTITKNNAKLSLRIPPTDNVSHVTHTLSQTRWAQQVILESINTTPSNNTLLTINIALRS